MTAVCLTVPTVETERLLLRAPQEADMAAMISFGTSERSHHIGGPFTAADCWRSLLTGLGHWALRGYGMWMIETRQGKNPAGRVGYINNPGWQEPELAWHVFDGFEGQSIAYEAALAARSFGAVHFGLKRPISYIAHSNTRSAALAQRLGAHMEAEGVLIDVPCQIWRHPQSEVLT